MFEYYRLRREVTAIDSAVELKIERINELKEQLTYNRDGITGETRLLGELTREIVHLRELRDQRDEMEARMLTAKRRLAS